MEDRVKGEVVDPQAYEDKTNSWEELGQNQEGDYQTYKISFSVLFLLECLDDIVHASVIYGSMHDTNHKFEVNLQEKSCDEDSQRKIEEDFNLCYKVEDK